MSKVICVADTSALRHLGGSVVAGKDILHWLWAELEVHVTAAILGEISDTKLRGRVQQHEVTLGRTARPALEKMAGGSLDGFHDPELSLVALGLRLLLARAPQVRHVVFLCDDEDAVDNGRSLFHALPSFCYWTSADFVLYLALRLGRRKYSRYEQFREALDMAIAHMAGGVLQMDDRLLRRQAGKQKWLAFKERYERRLKAVFDGSKVNW